MKFQCYNWLVLGVCLITGFTGVARAQVPDPKGNAVEETIIVTSSAVGARADELLQGVTVVGDSQLSETAAAGLGDVLASMPGISTTAFGPAASRPVIRGLGGDRVRMLVNGVGIMDASTASPDHAVSAEALEATRIEVVRGPAAIVYGGNAIGGVVNVIDGRIPEAKLDAPIVGRFVTGVSSVDRGDVEALRLRTGLGPLVFNGETVRRHGGVERISGFARTPALRALEGDGPKDRLPNSDLTFNTRAIGGSYVGNWGFGGASIKRSTANYGLPQEEDARIDMAQTRLDARTKIDLNLAAFDQLSVDFGISDYRHFELENGDIGTRFDNESWEVRARTRQKEIKGWAGSLGFDAVRKVFSAVGDESFLPKTRTRDLGAFIAERRDYGKWGIEIGGRLETRDLRTAFASRDFTVISLSGGAFIRPRADMFLSLSASRTERAPTDIELFSDGPHLAESTFERGNQNLNKESALSFEAVARFHAAGWDTHVNLFHSDFRDFVFLNPTGGIIDGLAEFIYLQDNAKLSGTEISVERDLWQQGTWRINGGLALEYVRARTDNFGNLPRIPPLEITGELNLVSDRLENHAELIWTNHQSRTAVFETPTKGSIMVNFSTTIRPIATSEDVRVVFKLSNLTNATHRTHASFLKDRLPAAGRSLSARLVIDF